MATPFEPSMTRPPDPEINPAKVTPGNPPAGAVATGVEDRHVVVGKQRVGEGLIGPVNVTALPPPNVAKLLLRLIGLATFIAALAGAVRR